jgi:hypothetical protein
MNDTTPPVSGIVRMNIAAMDSGDLVLMKGAMIIGLAVEMDPVKREEALQVVELIEAEQNARAGRVYDDAERRADTDCACPDGDECPCEADGPDGLCACCRTSDHRGSCVVPPAAGDPR